MKKILIVLMQAVIALCSLYGLVALLGAILGPELRKIEEEMEDEDFDFFEDI